MPRGMDERFENPSEETEDGEVAVDEETKEEHRNQREKITNQQLLQQRNQNSRGLQAQRNLRLKRRQ